MTRSLPMLLCLPVLLTACWPRNMARDVDEINTRYPHIFKDGTCSSWIHSAKTGHMYCASPPFRAEVDMPVAAVEKVDETKIDKASLMARGEKVYGEVCAACHQANGQGVPGAFPPLAGAGEFYGPPKKHARIIVEGLSGEIVVKGQTYNGVMPAQGSLSDYDIAAAATYVRHSWGNNDGIVVPADVAAVR